MHWLWLLSQWIPAITHIVVLIASGGQVHASYTKGIWSKSRVVCSIVKKEHGLMSWPLGFEKRDRKVLKLVLHVCTGPLLSFLRRFEYLSTLSEGISIWLTWLLMKRGVCREL